MHDSLLFARTLCGHYSNRDQAQADPSKFAAAVAAPAAAATPAAAAAPAKAEEPEEESDDDMGFGLFD